MCTSHDCDDFRTFFMGVKQPELEADHSSLSSADVNNEWNSMFPSQNAYRVRGGTQKKPETFSGGRVRCSMCFRRYMPLAGTLLH
jgi:hypothetical protein